MSKAASIRLCVAFAVMLLMVWGWAVLGHVIKLAEAQWFYIPFMITSVVTTVGMPFIVGTYGHD